MRAPTLFSHSAESNVYAQPHFRFKMTDTIMTIQQDKMALIFLILDVFGSLNIQIDEALLVNLLVYSFFHADI